MATIAQIQALVNSYITTGGDITAVELAEILSDMLDSMGTHPVVDGDHATLNNVVLSSAKQGSVINGETLVEGDILLCLGQTTTSEKGIYKIGLNDGDTERHDDYPDMASCYDKLYISKNPDENNNSFFRLQELSGELTYKTLGGIVDKEYTYGVGSYTETIPANSILERILIISDTRLEIKIGYTAGGEEILPNEVIADNMPISLGKICVAQTEVYFTIAAGNARIIFETSINKFYHI